jgi:hypothetical protein
MSWFISNPVSAAKSDTPQVSGSTWSFGLRLTARDRVR